jgi:hypothetical protein
LHPQLSFLQLFLRLFLTVDKVEMEFDRAGINIL